VTKGYADLNEKSVSNVDVSGYSVPWRPVPVPQHRSVYSSTMDLWRRQRLWRHVWWTELWHLHCTSVSLHSLTTRYMICQHFATARRPLASTIYT